MKVFVTMCFALVAMAVAKPAYDYQQPPPIQQNFVGSVSGPAPGPVFSPAPQFGGQHVEVAGPGPQYAQQQFVSSAGPQFVGPATQHVASVHQTTVFTPQTSSVVSSPQYNGQVQQQQQVIVNKDIFIHSAPEETEEIGGEQGPDQLRPIHKNYRIVFIKAPSHNIKFNTDSLKRAQAANEEKTVIYVLSKKPDIDNLQSQLSAVQNEPKAHKHEVHFIKYKTQEEANRAQQEIQAQYDSLGGSTHITDAGYAPVTSVVGGGSVGSVVSDSAPAITGGVVSGPSYSSGAVGGISYSSGGASYSSGGAVDGTSYSSGGAVGGTSYSSGGATEGTSYTSGGVVSGPAFSSGPSVSTVSHHQQSFQTSQGPSTLSFDSEGPSNQYLPAAAKKK